MQNMKYSSTNQCCLRNLHSLGSMAARTDMDRHPRCTGPSSSSEALLDDELQEVNAPFVLIA
jgi:hypothetical protein